MGDINELIAKNANLAYQQGINKGAQQERERIVKMLEKDYPNLTTAGVLRVIARAQK